MSANANARNLEALLKHLEGKNGSGNDGSTISVFTKRYNSMSPHVRIQRRNQAKQGNFRIISAAARKDLIPKALRYQVPNENERRRMRAHVQQKLNNVTRQIEINNSRGAYHIGEVIKRGERLITKESLQALLRRLEPGNQRPENKFTVRVYPGNRSMQAYVKVSHPNGSYNRTIFNNVSLVPEFLPLEFSNNKNGRRNKERMVQALKNKSNKTNNTKNSGKTSNQTIKTKNSGNRINSREIGNQSSLMRERYHLSHVAPIII